MMKILVVDDEIDLEVLIKQKYRQKIREKEYEFVFAVNGRDALDKLVENPDIEIILSDINMPEMDGLTLLGKLNESSPLIKSVIISAYGDMSNIRTAMNLGAFDFITKPINFEDLSVTISKTIIQVKLIKETLKAIKENNILKMYVDKSVLSFMDSRVFESELSSNESIEATVVFIDICHFTSISETASADNVVLLLNNYFDVMVKEIIAQGGYIDKFIGDAIMAVFRDDFHLDRALDAALAVRSAIDKLPDILQGVTFSPKVSIGINTGEMICGNIGSNNLKRFDYTVIGDVVNVAQRLQVAAKEGQILINENTYDRVKESFECKSIGEVVLKNKAKAVKAYEVME